MHFIANTLAIAGGIFLANLATSLLTAILQNYARKRYKAVAEEQIKQLNTMMELYSAQLPGQGNDGTGGAPLTVN